MAILDQPLRLSVGPSRCNKHVGVLEQMLTRKQVFSHVVRKLVFSQFYVRVWLHGCPGILNTRQKPHFGYNKMFVPDRPMSLVISCIHSGGLSL